MSDNSLKVRLHVSDRVRTWDADVNIYKLHNCRECVMPPTATMKKLKTLIRKLCSDHTEILAHLSSGEAAACF